MKYIVNIYVLDKDGVDIEDSVSQLEFEDFVDGTTIKSSIKIDEKYTNISSHELTSKQVLHGDDEPIKTPFLTYTIKLD